MYPRSRKFLCNDCGEEFTRKYNLGRHISRLHMRNSRGLNSRNDRNHSRIICPVCESVCVTFNYLEKHLQSEHNVELNVTKIKLPSEEGLYISCISFKAKYKELFITELCIFQHFGDGKRKKKPHLYLCSPEVKLTSKKTAIELLVSRVIEVVYTEKKVPGSAWPDPRDLVKLVCEKYLRCNNTFKYIY